MIIEIAPEPTLYPLSDRVGSGAPNIHTVVEELWNRSGVMLKYNTTTTEGK